jgi:hypothetical protein
MSSEWVFRVGINDALRTGSENCPCPRCSARRAAAAQLRSAADNARYAPPDPYRLAERKTETAVVNRNGIPDPYATAALQKETK